MGKKYKCFWCNKKFVDLEKHTKNMHPKLTARSYDYIKPKTESNLTISYIDPRIVDASRGITYKRAELTRWEKIKIYFGFMKEPKRIRIEPKMLCDLIPRVKITTGFHGKTRYIK